MVGSPGREAVSILRRGLAIAIVGAFLVSSAPATTHGLSLAATPVPLHAVQVRHGPTTATAPTSTAHWENLTRLGTAPVGRNRAVFVNDPSAGYTLLFGGYDAGGAGWLGDTWTLSAGVWTPHVTSTTPGSRSSASAAYDPGLQGIVLFGGFNFPGPYYNDTWLFKAGNWSVGLGAGAPSVRSEASMAYDPALQKLVLYGGTDGSSFFNDTWTYDASGWSRVSTGTAPPRLSGASMAYDSNLSALVLYGGSQGGPPLAGTWTFNGIWSQVVGANAPGGRSLSAMATLPNGTPLLCGGQNLSAGAPQVDAWEFVGANWVVISAGAGPNSRASPAMTYDRTDGYPLLFGGRYFASGVGHQSLNDTWAFDTLAGRLLAFSASGVAPFTVSPLASVVGGAIGPGNVSTVAYNWSFGDGSSSTAPAPNHTYGLAGNETLSLSVSDGFGLAISFQTNVVVGFSVNITIASVANSNLTYNFTVLTPNSTAPVTVSWLFGDGTTSTHLTPTHVYAAAGSYVVQAHARDAHAATGSTSRTFTASAPKAGPPPGSSSNTTGSAGTPLWVYAAIVGVVVLVAVVAAVIVLRRTRRPGRAERPDEPTDTPPQ